MQVTRDEAHTPTSFHANVVAMEKGHLDIEDVARDYVHCTQCGACELRCPNTLFTGDFYRFRTRTVDLVKAVRALAVESGIHQPHWQRVERAHRRAQGRARAQRDAGLAGARGRLGRRASTCRSAARPCMFCDCEAAFYRTTRAARGGADPQEGGRRVRPHAGAVVLRRAGRGDGLRRPGAALRRAQRRRLARGRREADPRHRPARLHLLHRGLPALLRRGLRLRDRARRRARRRADPRGQARADRADRARRDLPRRLPAQQAQGHPQGAARDPAGDSGPDVQGRRPRDPVVVLLGRRRRPRDRAARPDRRDQPPSRREGEGTRGRHARLRLRLVGAPAHRAGREAGRRGRRPDGAGGRSRRGSEA